MNLKGVGEKYTEENFQVEFVMAGHGLGGMEFDRGGSGGAPYHATPPFLSSPCIFQTTFFLVSRLMCARTPTLHRDLIYIYILTSERDKICFRDGFHPDRKDEARIFGYL